MDIDGTQVRRKVHGKGTHANALKLRQRLIDAPNLIPGFITGRTMVNAESALKEAGLISPQASVPYGVKITQGGVEVRNAQGQLWPGWQEAVSKLAWNKPALQKMLERTVANANAKLGEELISHPPQGVHGDFRSGIYFDAKLRERLGDQRLHQLVLSAIVEPLSQQAQVLHERKKGSYEAFGKGKLRLATVVYNSNSVPGRLNIDFMPVTSAGQPLDKLAAMKWLTPKLGLKRSEVVFAGDAHNDPLLRAAEAGFKVIVVGNAAPDLKEQLKKVRDQGRQGSVHISKSEDAAGVVEGLQSLGLLD